MKKTFFVFFVLLAASFTASAQTEQIEWQNDFKAAQAQARETGRPLLLDFTAPWCKPCKMMDAQFWVLPEVIQAMKPFIAVKINYDNEKSLVGKYGVSGIPFVAFTDPLGNMITFRRGFGQKNVREINLIFNEMPKDFSALKKHYDALDAKKDDGLVLLQIADSYRNSQMIYLSSEFYKKALKTDEIKTDAEKKERIIATLGANAYAIKADEQAINYFSDYIKEYPSGKSKEVALSMLIISTSRLKKMKDANKYLEMLKTEFPKSKNIEVVSKAIEDAKNKMDKP